MGGGLLGGRPGENDRGRRSYIQPTEQITAFQALCDEIGHPAGDVALAWVARQPGVTAPVIGPRTMAQLESSLAALEIDFSDETLARLDALFPGPGGQAPEAYAW